MPVIRTLDVPVRVELPRVKGSRFVADAAPAPDEAAAKAMIDRVVRASPDASHHCWAWRLADGSTRSTDAGEPGGTAGEPILKRITGHDLHGVVVVVTRWFGGTKLGMGGLVRAYGGAAGEALDAALVREIRVSVTATIAHPYELSGAVAAVLAAHELTPESEAYDSEVRLTVSVPVELVEAFAEALSERTSGRVELRTAGADPG